MQYEAFAKASKAEINNRKVVSPVNYDHIEEAHDNENSMTTYSTGNTVQQNQTANADYSGWNNMMSEVGFKGSVDTMKNLGLSLANLPEMLISLFSGKMRNEGLTSGTILPFALINRVVSFPIIQC